MPTTWIEPRRLQSVRASALILATFLAWACHAAELPPPLLPLSASELCVTSGRIEPLHDRLVKVSVGGMRAVAARKEGSAAELQFTYRGPSLDVKPLGSGEVRRQIGLKLRAQDSCNVLYVMWHVEPTPGIAVSIKSSPGKRTHAQCGDSGYINLPRGKAVAAVEPGTPHTLRAVIDSQILRVFADGALVWERALAPQAFGFDGPVGVRSDNGAFDFSLLVPQGSRASCPAKD